MEIQGKSTPSRRNCNDLTTENSAAMNIRVHVSFVIIVFSRYTPSGGVAEGRFILSS